MTNLKILGISQGRPLAAVGSLAMVLALGACGGAQETQATAGGAQPAVHASAAAQTAASPAAVQKITIDARDLSFTPTTVQLAAGRPVELTVKNDGQVDHDIKSDIPIKDLKYLKADNEADEQKDNAEKGVLDVDFNKGDTSQVTFIPTKAGTYGFECDQPGHAEAGMKGTFNVVASGSQAAG